MMKTETVAKGKCFGSPGRQRDSLVTILQVLCAELINLFKNYFRQEMCRYGSIKTYKSNEIGGKGFLF